MLKTVRGKEDKVEESLYVIIDCSTSFHLFTLLNYSCSLYAPPFSLLLFLPFPSLHFISLHFTSLHFTSLHFTSLPFTSLPSPSLSFPSLSSPYSLPLPHLQYYNTTLYYISLYFISLLFFFSHLVTGLYTVWCLNVKIDLYSPCKNSFISKAEEEKLILSASETLRNVLWKMIYKSRFSVVVFKAKKWW